MAAIHWLTCLASDDAPVAVVCEHVEDVVIVHVSGFQFAQLKTRDKGSWSAQRVCSEGYGVDSLVRSYLAASTYGLHSKSTFELWLEGPMAETRETAEFFGVPSSATDSIRSRIIALGLPEARLDDFLSRLIIRPHQPSRRHIDAVILQHIGALWPFLTTPERLELFESILQITERAQANENGSSILCEGLSEGFALDTNGKPASLRATTLLTQTLTRSELRTLTPPLPSDSREDLLKRIAAGEVTSALELKMRSAGVRRETIQKAQNLRADAEIVRQELLSSRPESEAILLKLEGRILQLAESQANRASFLSSGNAAIGARPGEFVISELLAQPHNLNYLDYDRIFQGNSDHIFGFLCHISDECKYWWKAET